MDVSSMPSNSGSKSHSKSLSSKAHSARPLKSGSMPSSSSTYLARSMMARGLRVVEVDCPNRRLRHRAGKSDTIDAIEAARAALSGRASGIAKTADGDVEAIRVLLVARRSGRNARIKYLNQIRHLGFTAPDDLRERLRGVHRDHLARTAAALRPNHHGDVVTSATKLALARCFSSRKGNLLTLILNRESRPIVTVSLLSVPSGVTSRCRRMAARW